MFIKVILTFILVYTIFIEFKETEGGLYEFLLITFVEVYYSNRLNMIDSETLSKLV